MSKDAINNDLDQWLKVANENKITTKNTWKSPLIDHFTNLSTFQEREGINFQKAGCTLDGCIKVYSTRVDDVSENAQKLMDLFAKEETVKPKKKKSNFIDTTGSNNIKMKENEDFFDSIFQYVFSRNDDTPLLNILAPSDAGIRMYQNDFENRVILKQYEVDIEPVNLPVCAGIKDFKWLKEEIAEMATNAQGEAEFADFLVECQNEDMDFAENLEPEHGEAEFGDPIPIKSPFAYFKGWAGPSHWKIDTNRHGNKIISQKKEKRQKEIFKIDFKEEINTELLYDKVDSTMTKKAIKERRKTKNLLPEDYSYGIQDLYKYFMKEGTINCIKNSEDLNEANPIDNDFADNSNNDQIEDSFNNVINEDEEENMIDENTINENTINENMINENMINENNKKEVLDFNNSEFKFSENFKYTKFAKKVDIKKLNENIYKNISKEKTNLSAIYKKIGEIYSKKEAKDISVHFCLISLLHLANENGLELKEVNGDIEISKI